MTLSSTIAIAELQYWIENSITNSIVNKYQVPAPATIPQVYLPQKSFIELLFNESFRGNSYRYLYREVTDKSTWPYYIRNRIMVYAASAKYYVCDTTGVNFFTLQHDDFVLLDALLAYRNDSTAVIIVDSTATEFINNTLYASYENLLTPLSKLIYIYLELRIYGRYSHYDNNIPISPTNRVIENSFELFVLDKVFAKISSNST